jgi:hypothetical protein
MLTLFCIYKRSYPMVFFQIKLESWVFIFPRICFFRVAFPCSCTCPTSRANTFLARTTGSGTESVRCRRDSTERRYDVESVNLNKTFRKVSLVFSCFLFNIFPLLIEKQWGRIGRLDERLEPHPGKMSIYFHLLWSLYRISNNCSPSFPRLLNSSVAKH